VASATLTDRVYAALRDEIVGGRLQPGESIKEAEIASAMGVSRTPLREACARLASEHFLVRLPNRGYRVPTESPRDLLDLYPIMAALEVLAAETAFEKLGPAELASVRARNLELKAAIKRGDRRAMIEANNRFHQELAAPCGNDRLRTLLEDLRAQIGRFEYWSTGIKDYRERAVADHEEIVRAIEKRQLRAARALLRRDRLTTYVGLLGGSQLRES
jgi:DNA-binding GntR family transcriptional regulator